MTLPSPIPVSGPLRVKELNPAQVTAILGNDPRLIIPIGTCEQHGPHLPLGCDTIIVERMADDLSAEYGVLRAPTVEYGVNVDTERGFTGNASLRKKTLHRMLNDLIDSWEATGVREFILLTAHGHDPHQEALATVITTAARVRVVDLFGMNLSDLLEGHRAHAGHLGHRALRRRHGRSRGSKDQGTRADQPSGGSVSGRAAVQVTPPRVRRRAPPSGI
jgi:creatinine amidohydrolase/Fe(II)-dependent formamide hydrolase-like protein